MFCSVVVRQGRCQAAKLSSQRCFLEPLLSFFEQIKVSLATKLAVGADSGSMWALGAYSFPAIHLMTNWRDGHVKNFSAMNPVNNCILGFVVHFWHST